MLSYRHSFHAGNFADVLKHIVAIEILDHLRKKDKAFDYIDTHSGAGLYHFKSTNAQKLNEHLNGISRLSENSPPEVKRYLDIIGEFNEAKPWQLYPGSPLIAQSLLRPQDRSWLFELHPQDYEKLAGNMAEKKNARVSFADGLKGLLALLPPVSRRGFVLIDPSYEVKTEYDAVLRTVEKAYKKFATGIYAIWYPVVNRYTITELERKLSKSGMNNIQRFELGLAPDSNERGMTASGMFVINAPWGLMDTMKTILPVLVEQLGDGRKGFYACDVITGENNN